MKYFFKTLIDTGFLKIKYRIIFELKRFFYKILPSKIIITIINYFFKTPSFKEKEFFNLPLLSKYNKEVTYEYKYIKFNFLNDVKEFEIPFPWNNPKQLKLWNFNLHYFDWSRKFLDDSLEVKKWNQKAIRLDFILDDWINKNPLSKGNGWSSYTASLRARNWVWLFRCCPEMLNQKRLDSLWRHIIWINYNLELHIGGNHLIENLTSLIVCCCQFEGKLSNKIYQKSLKLLKSELNYQILEDGGHEERSASYHLLILDRLIEVGCILKISNKEIPDWLFSKIYKMFEWSKNIHIGNQNFPRFNDSPFDGCPNINIILDFANCFLNNESSNLKGLRKILLKNGNKFEKNYSSQINNSKVQFIDLPNTGWTILRPNKNWEFAFKNGKSCPEKLPGHAHSDLLSFDLFFDGKPIISETGTSIYGQPEIRSVERSSISHNTLQLAEYQPNHRKIKWVEPIEVWGNFRAAKKASIIKRDSGIKNKNIFWVLGSHDGFNIIKAFYERYIELYLDEKEDLIVICIDKVNCEKITLWRQWYHLGPNINLSLLENVCKFELNSKEFQTQIKETWYSMKFGERVNRKSLFFTGKLNIGKNVFKSTFKIPKNILINK